MKPESNVIFVNRSELFYSGELIISVIAIDLTKSSEGRTVKLNISSPDYEVLTSKPLNVGSVLTYTGKNIYKITIISIEEPYNGASWPERVHILVRAQ